MFCSFSREVRPIHGTAIVIPKRYFKKIIDQSFHHSQMPGFNCVSLINCRGQFEIFASLYLAPALSVPDKCDLLDQFQEALDNLILGCGDCPKIYLGADLNIDIDANRVRDKSILKKVSELTDYFALDDILRLKHSIDEFPGHTYNPPNCNFLPSRLDYFFVSRQIFIDMMLINADDPLKFSVASLVYKSSILSDHNGMHWTITTQPYKPIDYDERVSRCNFRPSILNNEKFLNNIYNEIFRIINIHNKPPYDLINEELIGKFDAELDYIPDEVLPNQVELLEDIIVAIKTIQVEYDWICSKERSNQMRIINSETSTFPGESFD